jgi:hypothetical protein
LLNGCCFLLLVDRKNVQELFFFFRNFTSDLTVIQVRTGENGRELGMAAGQNWGRKLGTEGEKNWGLNWGKLFFQRLRGISALLAMAFDQGSSKTSDGGVSRAKGSMSLNSVMVNSKFLFIFRIRCACRRASFSRCCSSTTRCSRRGRRLVANARSLASARADAAASGGFAAGSLLLVQASSADIDTTNLSIENNLLICVCFL